MSAQNRGAAPCAMMQMKIAYYESPAGQEVYRQALIEISERTRICNASSMDIIHKLMTVHKYEEEWHNMMATKTTTTPPPEKRNKLHDLSN